ncbi:hypothetical protein M0802_016410 [Mischocyttarus mexicanus]|nr:hypothetical protein M0802_016410 [Mischocyttarus mexicanus]
MPDEYQIEWRGRLHMPLSPHRRTRIPRGVRQNGAACVRKCITQRYTFTKMTKAEEMKKHAVGTTSELEPQYQPKKRSDSSISVYLPVSLDRKNSKDQRKYSHSTAVPTVIRRPLMTNRKSMVIKNRPVGYGESYPSTI